jgi:hypothetical protein
MAKVGRPARTVLWTTVAYNGADYVVGKIQFCEDSVYCVNDAIDMENILKHSWHVVTGAYVGCYKMHEGKKKTMYMHNFILGRDAFQGKGQEESVDHRNGIGYDNRRANLRVLSQSLQNMNTRQRTRTTDRLPDGIDPRDIPRNVWYIPATGSHGDRFCVEFKGIPTIGDIVRKTTSSKDVSIRNKLQQAIDIRQDILDAHPILKEYSRESDSAIQLKKDYENIVALSKGEPIPHKDEPLSDVKAPVSDVETIVETLRAGSMIEHVLPESPTLPEHPEHPEQPEHLEQLEQPKQWKTRDIYDFLSAHQEHVYKAYCEANNDTKTIPWEHLWSDFLTIKGQPWETAEPRIRAFVEDLRRRRHNALTAKPVLDREDRERWPAETVTKLYRAGRIAEYKAITEEYAGDSPTDSKWQKRWIEFVGNLDSLQSDSDITAAISKFMHAQRAKKHRRSKTV